MSKPVECPFCEIGNFLVNECPEIDVFDVSVNWRGKYKNKAWVLFENWDRDAETDKRMNDSGSAHHFRVMTLVAKNNWKLKPGFCVDHKDEDMGGNISYNIKHVKQGYFQIHIHLNRDNGDPQLPSSD